MRSFDRIGQTLAVLGVLTVAAAPAKVAGQSLTSGSLRVVVRNGDGAPLRGVTLTLEGRSGGVVAATETGAAGAFRMSLLAPGEYRLVAELLGYQPIRVTGILVTAGETTVLDFALEERPPPIERVEDVPAGGTRVGTTTGRLIALGELGLLDWRRDASDGVRGASELVWPTDGRAGFGLAASGLSAAWSRLIVDGVYETHLRHLGIESDPASFPAHTRDRLTQMRVIGVPLDAEWRGTPGSIVLAQSLKGGDRVRFTPFVNGSSASLGSRPLDNPLDSSATSFQFGATLGGPIVRDTAHFLLGFDYRSLRMPTSYPWANDDGAYRGTAAPIRATALAIAQDTFGIGIGAHLSPAVRTWKGASGFGKVDWQLSASNRVWARFSFSDWDEGTPFLGNGSSLGAGATLDGRDIAGAGAFTTAGSTLSNEFRAGFSTARRIYNPSSLPETGLATEGIAFGGTAASDAFFDVRTIDVSDAIQWSWEKHLVKAGGNLTSTTYQYDYRYGNGGIFQFGSLDGFGAGHGLFYQAVGAEIARYSTLGVGAFLQDTWQPSPELQLLVGIRYDLARVPKSKIGFNADWYSATGTPNDSIKTSHGAIAPRLAFVWDVRGEWVLKGGVGLHYGQLDPAAFGEAMLYDGGVTVRRGLGTFSAWPALPSAALAPTVGPALTILNPTWRPPRTFKADFGLNRVLGSGLTLNLAGSYHHSDYLAQRVDLNRLTSPVGTTQEGRPVFGSLTKTGGFLGAVPGSNRRFTDFDLVSGISPTGFADHYEVTGSILRQLSRGWSLIGSYTYSKTTDNLTGQRSIDPADRLSPFPGGLNGVDWDKGRSDLDIPHRAAVTLEYRSTGSRPVTIAARYRARSGLPFTPGFRPGVDANADGAGNNDPAFLGGSVAGLADALSQSGCSVSVSGQFAERNSCREKMQHGLDVRLGFGLPFISSRALMLELDAFNLVATETGVIDRAAVLIDPNGTVVVGSSGNIVLPLIANPRFGSLLVRRGESRVIRLGLRMEY